jgi:SAM-dependent methyltransferase
MHPLIFEAFNEICRNENAGGEILEIGATLSANTLLNLPTLRSATSRIGIDLGESGEFNGFQIVTGNANDMRDFKANSFDVVLSNSMLEHDPFFWKSLKQIRRVARPGALIVIGVPSYEKMGSFPMRRFFGVLARIPVLPKSLSHRLDGMRAASPTLGLHLFPGDFYRFSEAAVREVLLAGTTGTHTRQMLHPPRIIGWGRLVKNGND